LIKDIISHFNFEAQIISYEETILSLPFIQLLIVLPPSCAHMIPLEKVRQLMLDESKGLVHLFPNKFNVETYLKNKDWEYIPKLPIISLAEIEYYFRLCI
jgi:5'-3' exonuclease